MTDYPIGQMTWKPDGSADRALHLRLDPADSWRPYQDFPEYKHPDPPDFSEGFTTFMALLKNGWEIV